MEEWIQILSSGVTTNILLIIGLCYLNNLDRKLGILNRTAYKGVYKEDLG